jgi:hypothetical protein
MVCGVLPTGKRGARTLTLHHELQRNAACVPCHGWEGRSMRRLRAGAQCAAWLAAVVFSIFRRDYLF